MPDEPTFVCRTCEGKQFFSVGTIQRAYIVEQEKEGAVSTALQQEVVNLYACAACTTVFILPPAFSKSSETPDVDDLPPRIHPSHEAEED